MSETATSSGRGLQHDRLLRFALAGAVGLVLLGALFIALWRVGGTTVTQFTTNRDRAASMRNLTRIAEALNAYAADYGSYPPSATVDSTGKKLHSWRVLILPYLGEEELYSKFDLSKSWDDPKNFGQSMNMPSPYRHPGGLTGAMPGVSAYYLIVGPGTLHPSLGPLGPNGITDRPSHTILVAEGSPLVPSGSWTEPMDLDITKMRGDLTANPGIELGGQLEDGVCFATVDGRAHYLPMTVEPRRVLALITAGGGERLPDDLLE
jgi:hypothetical protein